MDDEDTIVISINYCAFCGTEATHKIEETDTPLCYTCREVYIMGKENQGTIEDI